MQNGITTAIDPNVIQYTQASGGLGISMGALSLFAALSIILRIGNFKKLGVFGKIFLLVVSLPLMMIFHEFSCVGIYKLYGDHTIVCYISRLQYAKLM